MRASLDEDQLRVMERRVAEHQADPASAISWEEAKTRLRERFGA